MAICRNLSETVRVAVCGLSKHARSFDDGPIIVSTKLSILRLTEISLHDRLCALLSVHVPRYTFQLYYTAALNLTRPLPSHRGYTAFWNPIIILIVIFNLFDCVYTRLLCNTHSVNTMHFMRLNENELFFRIHYVFG